MYRFEVENSCYYFFETKSNSICKFLMFCLINIVMETFFLFYITSGKSCTCLFDRYFMIYSYINTCVYLIKTVYKQKSVEYVFTQCYVNIYFEIIDIQISLSVLVDNKRSEANFYLTFCNLYLHSLTN